MTFILKDRRHFPFPDVAEVKPSMRMGQLPSPKSCFLANLGEAPIRAVSSPDRCVLKVIVPPHIQIIPNKRKEVDVKCPSLWA